MRWTVRRLVAHLHALSGIVCFLSVRFNLFDGECWWWFASFSKNKSVALCDSTLEQRVCLHRVWHPIVFCDWQRPLQIEMQTYHSIAGKSSRILPQILFLSISSFQVTSSLLYWSSSIGPSNNNNSNSCHPWCCWFAFSYHCLSLICWTHIFIELKYVIIIMAHREIRGSKSAIFILYLQYIPYAAKPTVPTAGRTAT